MIDDASRPAAAAAAATVLLLLAFTTDLHGTMVEAFKRRSLRELVSCVLAYCLRVYNRHSVLDQLTE